MVDPYSVFWNRFVEFFHQFLGTDRILHAQGYIVCFNSRLAEAYTCSLAVQVPACLSVTKYKKHGGMQLSSVSPTYIPHWATQTLYLIKKPSQSPQNIPAGPFSALSPVQLPPQFLIVFLWNCYERHLRNTELHIYSVNVKRAAIAVITPASAFCLTEPVQATRFEVFHGDVNVCDSSGCCALMVKAVRSSETLTHSQNPIRNNAEKWSFPQ
jgi:hypothetical protein